ncbi:MAG: S-layer homology domain-containing protein, partial [Hominilimicola sp.]
TAHSVTAPVTEEIKVEKKVINVTADDTTSVYGAKAEISFKYKLEDFENEENPSSPSFTDGLTEPIVQCEIDEKSEADEYTVTVSGAEATNYAFEYHNGTHTITPRPLTVTRITGGVPPLTSDIIYTQPGEEHELEAWADNSRMEVSNAVNDDDIKIIYKAGYDSVTPVESTEVKVLEAKLEEGYGRNKNYTLESVVQTAAGGRIYDKEITAVEITEQPKLKYTYGEKLDLSGGKVKITYDSGLVEEDLTFAELTNHRITLTYTGTEEEPVNGEVLTVPKHNTKTITLTPATAHSVTAPVTEEIKVEKKLLTYGKCIVNPIVYDGITTLTTGTIVFIGAENNDTINASGVFNFEDYLAGENKTVYITDIKLDAQSEQNYKLAENNTTATGVIKKETIEKEVVESQLSESKIILSEDNVITIVPPEMTQEQLDGGAEYEYSIDGGNTWDKSNIFDNLELGRDCNICIRFAETSNYNQSVATIPVPIKTYRTKVTLIVYKDDTQLTMFFTNTESVKNEKELKALIGDVGVTYYQCYLDKEAKTQLKYPLDLNGDVVIYTTLKNNSKKGGSDAASTPTPASTLTPVATSTPNPTFTPTPDVPTEKPEKKHEPYMSGYDGMILPDAYMTRAEAATIMVNINGDTGLEYENVFPDVNEEFWYARFISQASERGLISGFEDGTFRPEEIVTREQFASMVARMMNFTPVEAEPFADVPVDRWSAGYINVVYQKGIVSGYDDGTFRPENPITRAEAVCMINKATERVADRNMLNKIKCPFTDLPKAHWAYYEMMEASCEY